MMLLGLRRPARLPASSATANMLSDSGASERPASSASYSSTICRKIGSAIIRPPRAICCSVCDEIPRRKYFDANRPGVDQRQLVLALAPHQPPHERAESDDADRDQRSDRLAALLPDEDPEHDTAHAERGEDRADDVEPPVPVYGTSWTRLLPTSTIAMITTSPPNATLHER